MSMASRTAWLAVSEPSVPTTIELNMIPLRLSRFGPLWPARADHTGARPAAGAERFAVQRRNRLLDWRREPRARDHLLLGLVGAHGRARAAALGACRRRAGRRRARDRPRL